MNSTQDNPDIRRDSVQTSINSSKAVFIDQVKLLYGNGKSSVAGIVVITLLVWASLRWISKQPHLIDIWMLYMMLTSILRLWLVLSFQKHFKAENVNSWSHYFTVSAAMAGLGWGMISLFFLIVPNTSYQIAIVMIVLGIMAASVPILSIIWPTFIASLAPPTITLLSIIFLWENDASLLLTGALSLYTLLIVNTARNNHKTLVQTFRLHKERELLITHLDDEILVRKKAQKELEQHQIQLENLVDARTKELQQINIRLTEEVKEREKSELKIRHAHERFTKIMDSLDALVYVADIQSHEILFMNKFAHEKWGEQEGQKCWEKLQAKQSGACEFCINDKLLDADNNSTGVQNIEFRNTITGDWLENRTQAITWPDGRVVRLTIATIINDRKHADDRIKEERAFLQSIIDGVADPILVIRKDYQVQLMNNAAGVFSSLQVIPEHYQTCYQTIHHSDHVCEGEAHQCPLQEVLKTGKPSTVLHKHTLNDGSVRSFEIIASPLFNKDNEITSIVQVSRDITEHLEIQDELREKKSHLDHLAHHDELTKLPNRLLLSDRLNQTIKKAHRDKQKVAVLFIDLDHFKEINDSLGHNVGDKILKETAIRLQHCVRDTDTVARLGGDEFTIIINDINDDDIITEIATKIIRSLQSSFSVDEHELYVTSSIGISIYPNDANSVKNLLRNADAAMYKAKEEGRNTYQFYTEDMTQKAFEHILMESNLRHALGNSELIVYYQPQVNGHTNKIVGMEALVRWQHPQLGLISPARFISLAEKTGLIVPIDKQVFNIASKQMAHWMQKHKVTGRMAINLSVKQFQQTRLIDILLEKLHENHCKPEWIELEITENYVIDDPERAIATLQKLQNIGFEIAIDDFGAGYSSLSYLKRLPINKLKIDQSFVRDIMNDENDKVIITSTISLAKNMKLNVIAEGVETIEQKDFILGQGCEMIQGYYYSRPLPATEMNKLLDSSVLNKS